MINTNSLAFGTSGIRGLVTSFTEEECYAFIAAFLESFKDRGFGRILIAGDLRESTGPIVSMLIRSLNRLGMEVLDGGLVPTPALAWACSVHGIPGVMVTGSHIPADRNGLKFYLPEGEVLKSHEESILSNYKKIKFEKTFHKSLDSGLKSVQSIDIASNFVDRYLNSKMGQDLNGIKIGFYAHSSVARDLYPKILRKFGAEVFVFGRSEQFIPVDTEAVERVSFLKQTLIENDLDLIFSTDGDADRPLVISDQGGVVPGELLGLLASKYLGIDTIVFPVSCSSAIVSSGLMKECVITKIGSPYVLGKMLEMIETSDTVKIAGFEANGGFLLGTEVMGLKPLMTRDSLLPLLSLLFSVKAEKAKVSELLLPFSKIVNHSGLIRDFPKEKSDQVLRDFKRDLENEGDSGKWSGYGGVKAINELDGIRVQFKNGWIVHLRPSGNAPEFRMYVEADSGENAVELLDRFKKWVSSESES
jgi:phosphomannomutase